MGRFRLEVVDFEPDDLAVASPEKQACLLAVRIHCQFICEHLYFASLSLRFEVQARTPAGASANYAQLSRRVKPISCYVNQCVIEQPIHNFQFIQADGSFHDSSHFTLELMRLPV